MIELPPLPYGASPTYGYTEAEMRAYGEACARAAIREAATLCDQLAAQWKPAAEAEYSRDDYCATCCAEAIRTLAKP
jgi:hypothetical protein